MPVAAPNNKPMTDFVLRGVYRRVVSLTKQIKIIFAIPYAEVIK